MDGSDDLLSGLSEETMKALREFALQQGVSLDVHARNDRKDLIDSVLKHFQVQDREEFFPIEYSSNDQSRTVKFGVKGVKRELGQTLSSTGLTIWRAAEHLCQYIIDNPQRFQGKSVCELGAGLGLVSILLEKLEVCSELVVTDGDEDTLSLLVENKIDNDCLFETNYLLWGEQEDFLSEHSQGFDLLIAADVIYEEEQILPLLQTVNSLLKHTDEAEFILAFARRNVSIDKVLFLAENEPFFLRAEVLDDSFQGIAMEPIYSLKRRRA